MSNNAGSCQIIKFEPVKEVPEVLQNFAEEFFEVVSNDYTDDGLEQLVGYLRNSVQIADMTAAAEKFGITLPPYEVEHLQSNDWLADNVIKFAPPFLVHRIPFPLCRRHHTMEG